MNSVSSHHPSHNAEDSAAIFILESLFKDYAHALTIHLWTGTTMHIGNGDPQFTLGFRHPSVLKNLVLYRDPARLAEAYFDGALEITGNLDAAIDLRYYLENLRLSFAEKAKLILRAFTLNTRQPSASSSAALPTTNENSQAAISFHYDVSNEFYQLWLDERMVYSCAYFETPDQDIDLAQRNKLDHICRKLRLHPGESLLDIGCGWGALICWAASHYGVRAHGITLSRNQFDHAQKEIKQQGLEALVSVELRDYRDLPQDSTYDKVVSVGMFEHVGLKNLPTYFSTIHRVLKVDGIFLNHGITSDQPGWKPTSGTKLINRNVFPDGQLDTISNIQSAMENNGFEIFDVEGLRPHYGMTLRHWVSRLEQHRNEAIALIGERTYRVWLLYMTASALQFEQGSTGLYQIIATRKETGLPPLPLTRRDIYS